MCPGSIEQEAANAAHRAPDIQPEGRCSAFIATGSYTKGGKIVIAHNNWSSYAEGARWTVIFDIQPASGHHILMDGTPGVITSQDDFGVNDAGLLITETTITQFEGWDPDGKPEFVRSRKALQYAGSIDEYVAIIKEGNNGGYANDWLIGDRKTGEIAYLELGLKNTPLWRSKDGYFVSSNFARDPELIKTETGGFDLNNLASSPNARRVTWEKKMAESKGRIDVELAEQFMADHEDSFTAKTRPTSAHSAGTWTRPGAEFRSGIGRPTIPAARSPAKWRIRIWLAASRSSPTPDTPAARIFWPRPSWRLIPSTTTSSRFSKT